MGNSQAAAQNINNQNSLIQQIHAVAKELTDTYNSKFLDPKFCTSVALIYNDKLMNFRKQELNKVHMTLGLVADVPEKSHLCEAIIKHYTDRINLIAAIQQSLNYCSNRIFALSMGPRCEGNPEIFDQAVCTKSGGQWMPVIVPPDAELKENKIWYERLYNVQETYLKGLARLLDILNTLKNYDEDINDERLRSMGLEVEALITSMQQHCYDMYKLILTTPTYTAQELMLAQNSRDIAEQESRAQLAAARALQGLPPEGAK